MRIYFAHPVTDYGTNREGNVLTWLEADGWEVENPNQPHHQDGYARDGMVYFESLASSCDALVFTRFPDGSIGAGVGKEIDAAHGSGIPIYEWFGGELYSMYCMPTPVLSVEDTRSTITKLRQESP
jgi:hypothetical protein